MATNYSTLVLLVALSTACAYHNPTQPTPPAEDLTAPTTLTLGTLPAAGGKTIVTARVQNLHGTPLSNYVVQFTTSAGTVSPDVTNTGSDGTASTTLTCSSDARVSVTVGPMHNSTLIAAPNVVGPVQPTPSAGVFLNVAGSAQTGDPVTFSVSSSVTGVLWQWNFGDGGTDQTMTFSTTHVYGRAGTYLATVSGAGTATASAPVTVTNKPVVQPPPAPASFAATISCPTPTTKTVACNVSTSANGSPLPSSTTSRVDWDWGDGITTQTNGSGAAATTHVYIGGGTYTVFASVTGAPPLGTNQTATTSTSITVP